MNRNIVLLVILALAAAIAVFLWKTKKDPTSNMERTESNFRVEDIDAIDRIIITTKDGVRSELKRNGDHWLINGAHRVRPGSMEHLLRGIKDQQLDHIPTKAASEHIMNSMAVNGIHVEIYDKARHKILGYYIGGVTPDERATYFLKEGSVQPYALTVPGFEGSLRVRFSLKPVEWRALQFWTEENEKIDTLRVHYPKQRQHSFVLYKNAGGYQIKPMFSTTPVKKEMNRKRVESYFTTLEKLACEAYLGDPVEKDSIISSVAFMEMDMIYPDQSSYLNFYPIPRPVVTEYSTDIPSYYIDYAGKDFMIGQHEVVKGAFRSYEFFFD